MKEKSKRWDIYQAVTDRIVAELDRGCAPWVKPWTVDGAATDIPINGHSKRAYRGINTLLLWLTQAASGFASREWFTFNQVTQLGGTVRRGEKATLVVFWKQLEVEDADADEPHATKTVPVLRYYHVFNRNQIDALPNEAPPPVGEWRPVDRAEALVQASAARISHGGDRAYYDPGRNVIRVPDRGSFTQAGEYYATVLHELTHHSGHPTRLARAYGKRFGDTAYAREELVAEMGAAFLCASVGIVGRLQHPEYISHWLAVLRADKRAVFTAASHAQRAADYLLGTLAASTPEAGGPECGQVCSQHDTATGDRRCIAATPLREAS